MKCIRCNTDSKFKERTGKRCPKCGGAFAFEPQSGDPMTDMAFKAAIDAVSANGRMRWGVEHLYYEICRRWRRGRKNHWLAGLVAVVASGGSLAIPGLVPLKILTLVLSGMGTYFIYKLRDGPC